MIADGATGLERVSIRQRPKLLTDNGPCYASSELRAWLEANNVRHTRGTPYHPQTQGKIERWHRTLKDRILLEHYYLPGELERQITDFVHYYNTRRSPESLNTLTPECVFTGQHGGVLKQRNEIKREPIALRKKLHAERRAA